MNKNTDEMENVMRRQCALPRVVSALAGGNFDNSSRESEFSGGRID